MTADRNPPLPEAPTRSRARQRDDQARAKLAPLAAGERPRAVTVAAVLASCLGAANICAYALGARIADAHPPLYGVCAYSLLMFVAAVGLWRRRYWAAIAMQAMLACVILLFSLLALTAENLQSLVLALLVIAGSGALFWFLVKAMARIQLTDRQRHSNDQTAAGS